MKAVGHYQSLPIDHAESLLDVELGFQSGGSSATVHGIRDASIWLRGLDLGATYRYPLLRFLHPYARLAAGYDWATLELGNVLQRVGQPSVTAMGGIAVPVVQLERDGEKHPLFMLDFGVGYTLRPGMSEYTYSSVGKLKKIA